MAAAVTKRTGLGGVSDELPANKVDAASEAKPAATVSEPEPVSVAREVEPDVVVSDVNPAVAVGETEVARSRRRDHVPGLVAQPGERRGDDRYQQITGYVPEELHTQMRVRLLTKYPQLDQSALLELLIKAFVEERIEPLEP